MMKLTVAVLLVATAAADEFAFLTSSVVSHKMDQLALNCSVCGFNLGTTSPSISSNCAAPSTGIHQFTGTCGGKQYTSTCEGNGRMTNPGQSGLILAFDTATNVNQFACSATVNQGGAVSPCIGECEQQAAQIRKNLKPGESITCILNGCTPTRRRLNQGNLNGVQVFACSCSGLTGTSLTTCCDNCLTDFICAGAVVDTCFCNGTTVTCPGCSSGKGSPKLLLLLLLLLLLIPLLLCCLLLLCCCIRRKKREADTHFSTFAPGAPMSTLIPGPATISHMPVMTTHCPPVTHCVDPCMPATHCVDPCAPATHCVDPCAPATHCGPF